MSEWKTVPAGTVATQRKDVVTLAPGVEYRTMGVRWYGRGAYDRGAGSTETIKAKRLFRAHEGDFVFNRIDTQNGAFDVVPAELHGALATNEFPLYVLDSDRLLPQFLLLYFQQRSVLGQIDALRVGSEGRSRWKEADFEAWRIPLPPLSEQRRIVDVMAAVDKQIQALGEEADRAWASWKAVVADLDDYEGQLILSDGLRAIEAGKSPKGQERIPAPDERAVLKISAVGRARFIPSEVKTIDASTVLPEATKLRSGDVLMVRCNAILDRVGTVCRVNEVPENLYLCDKTLRLVPDEEVLLPNYLVHAMAAPSVRDQIARLTAGSDMRNIGQKAIRGLVIPDPGTDAQAVLASGLDELISEALAIEAELAHLRAFRAALLASLLNREIEIPESYDALLEVH
ncbi:restriction endonuclease subunit S [Streptomyces sp. NPDC017448]|uniref:restriction endonuclease subunit S n=1 Tax=Streptomyces sp. NPDC017448 TaxID=3364996 RepID=UPI00379BE665